MKKTGLLLFVVFVLLIAGCKKDNPNGGVAGGTPYVGSWDYSAIELDIDADHTFLISNAGFPFSAGRYTVSNSRITFTDTGGYCGLNTVGIYADSIFNSNINGDTHTFILLTLVSDSCSGRNTDMPGMYQKY